jgi:hypothetical protein
MSTHNIKIALFVFRNLIDKELKQPAPIGLALRINLWLSGFFSASHVLYRLNQNDYKLYLNDWQENYRSKFINQHTIYIDNKILFPQLMLPYIQMTEEPFLIMNGKLSALGKKRDYSDIDGLLLDIKKNGPKVFKPIDGASGNGIIKISFIDSWWQVNQKKIDETSCRKIIGNLSDYLVSDFITQGEYSKSIYPKSVNTVRMLTMLDPLTKQAFIAAAAHRIGNNTSYPVDNCAAGGFTAYIEPETGTMGKATSTVLKGKTLAWHTNHPDTGAPIEGVIIPNWANVRNTVLQMATSLQFIPYIGWDIVITDDGFTIIEANDGPDIKLHQVHKPLLADSRVANFYKHYHVI